MSQAQKQFTSLLSEVTTIVDKKSHRKKAVLIPYDLYEKLVNKKEIPVLDSESFLIKYGIET
ncbi:MAG TPA: hypothetical protein ENJ07_00805 [Gammaproteobacteria bacterium]|nr:hypothetical protein [Gammaproteobacteria bacterium]